MDGGYDASENMEGAYLSVLVNIVLLVSPGITTVMVIFALSVVVLLRRKSNL